MKIRAIGLPLLGASLSCLLLAACSKSPMHPPGWTAASSGTWNHAGQSYVLKTEAFDGTRKDLASQEAIDVVLRIKGARLVSSVPYPQCPGLGGLMTYAVSAGKPAAQTLLLAFSVQNATATTVTYRRPAGSPSDAAAMAAMTAATCQAAL